MRNSTATVVLLLLAFASVMLVDTGAAPAGSQCKADTLRR